MTDTTDRLAHAKEQGQAQFNSIEEMVAILRAARSDDDGGRDAAAHEEAEQAILEDALSVQVRSGWYAPGAPDTDRPPAEYEILLCTGGPACRIIGDLSEHGEPETAQLQVQDWGTQWTDFYPTENVRIYEKGRIPVEEKWRVGDAEETLLMYASCFYFGE